jgi:ABC-type lipoprotein export system ATPase subunit
MRANLDNQEGQGMTNTAGAANGAAARDDARDRADRGKRANDGGGGRANDDGGGRANDGGRHGNNGGTSSAMVRARGLGKEYGKDAALIRAVDDVNLEVAAGETLAVMGPSGCGKSTLLHLLGGLDRPSAGELWLAGQRIDQMNERGLAAVRRQAVGFVFQAFHLMEELTAVENIELPALLAGRSPRGARRRAADLLDQVGLADRARHLPSQLSGGQRQGVAIARALANEPLVVLADEPTGNLDSESTLDVLRLFDQLHEAGQTLVVVTHDARIAATADRMISMRDGSFVDETRLTGGTSGTGGTERRLSALVDLDG